MLQCAILLTTSFKVSVVHWKLEINWCKCLSTMIGGLASPPESHYNSPTIPSGSSEPQTLFSPNFSPPKFVDPRDLQYSMDVLQRHSQNNLMEQEIGSPMDKEEGSPMTGVEWRTLLLNTPEDEEEGDPMVVESEKLSPELSEDEEEGDPM